MLDSTFSSKQKNVILESPNSFSSIGLNKSFSKSKEPRPKSPVYRSKSPAYRSKSPINYSPQKMKGITDHLDSNTDFNVEFI